MFSFLIVFASSDLLMLEMNPLWECVSVCFIYPALARALGPQKAWGFSWNRVKWRLRDWGLASSLTLKQASKLHKHTHTVSQHFRLKQTSLELQLSETDVLTDLTWAHRTKSWMRGWWETASPSSQGLSSPTADNQITTACLQPFLSSCTGLWNTVWILFFCVLLKQQQEESSSKEIAFNYLPNIAWCPR